MKKPLIIILVCLLAFLYVGLYYYNHWKPLWSLEKPRTIYSVEHLQDDTVRILMIGDSWVGLRTDSLNHLLHARLSAKTGRPVIVRTKGKGGEKSRGIYQLMFETDGYGTKPLFMSGADYCVVFAGINDAAANLGIKQFIHHMKLIIDFLLANNIRPVIIEIPDVNIWSVYGNKPIKDLVVDCLKSVMTGCRVYCYSDYREALYEMLVKEYDSDSISYVSMNDWNGDVFLNPSLFMSDSIHLNRYGYERIDKSIAETIFRDLQHTKKSTLFNKPMK